MKVAVSPEMAVIFGSARVRMTPARSMARNVAPIPLLVTLRALGLIAPLPAENGLVLLKLMTVAPQLKLPLRSMPSCLIRSRCTSATVTFNMT